MKIGNFVQFIVDVQDLLSYFTGVKSRDQMISALERLKRVETDGVLDTIVSLQNSFEALTADDIETPSADEIESLFTDGEKPTEKTKEDTTPAERLGITETEKSSE